MYLDLGGIVAVVLEASLRARQVLIVLYVKELCFSGAEKSVRWGLQRTLSIY